MSSTLQHADPAFAPVPASRALLGGPGLLVIIVLAAVTACIIAGRLSNHIFAFPLNVADAPLEDLVVFHSIGGFLSEHSLADAYDPETFRAYLPEERQTLLWLNPPHAVFLLAPLGVLPYAAVKFLLFATSACAMAGLCRSAVVDKPWLVAIAVASPGMVAFAFTTQLGPILAFLTLFALTNARSRPLLAGLAIAVVTIKPQYGLLVPIFFIAAGAWRAFAAAAVFSSLLVLASVASFGVDAWMAFAQSATATPTGPSGVLQPASSTIGQLFGKLGATDAARLTAQLTVMPAAAIAVWVGVKRLPSSRAAGIAMILSLLIAPSGWTYDWPFVMAAILMLGVGQRWPVWLQVLAGIAWLAPAASFLSLPSIMPNLTLVALATALCWFELHTLSAPNAAPAPLTA